MIKKILANELISKGLVKAYDVIQITYEKTIRRKIKMGLSISSENNISPTLTTRCDCLGLVVKDDD